MRACWPIITFSSADIVGNRRMFWNVRAMPIAVIRSGRAREISRPSKLIDPAARPVEPGEHVEERRLAGAVGPDHRGDRPSCELEVEPVDGDQAAEALAHRLGGQQGSRGAHRGARSSWTVSTSRRSAPAPASPAPTPCSSSFRRRSGNRPSGRSTIMITSRKPKIP